VAALVGVFMAIFQAATQINDATLAHVPRFLAVTGALLLTGGMLARQLTEFAVRAFTLTP
jgi:flagellar biosynthesis protein FliQ